MTNTHITDNGNGPFYINYSLNGEHFIVGPYRSRRFAMTHIDDVRRIPGVSNVFLGNKGPVAKSYRHLLPITATLAAASLAFAAMQINTVIVPDWWGLWSGFPGLC